MRKWYAGFCLYRLILVPLIVLGYTSSAWAVLIYDTSGYAYDVAISGDYAYVADGLTGLKTINISDIDNAYQESVIKYTGETAKTVLVDEGYLYVAFREGGTKIFSLADPANPVLVATYENLEMDNPTWALSSNLKKVGNILYVGEKMGGLVALDVSDPTSPVELDRVLVPNESYPKEVQGIDVSGNYAFVANPWKGLAVIDISDPVAMEVVAAYNKPEGCYPGVWDVAINGDYAYILAQQYGVQVLDISDPTNPTFVTEYLMEDGRASSGDSPPADLLFYSNYLLVANGLDGISIFDITDQEILNFIMKIDTLGFVTSLEVEGSLLYYGDGASGIGVFDLSMLNAAPIPGSLCLLLTGWVGLYSMLLRRKKTIVQ